MPINVIAVVTTHPVVMLFISCLASCWCLGVTVKLWVGVDVATNGKASEARATCVRMGGIDEAGVAVVSGWELLVFAVVGI